MKSWSIFRKWKRQLLIAGIISGVGVGIALWLRGVEVATASRLGVLVAVIPNFYAIGEVTKGVYQVMNLGIRQAELNQKDRNDRLERFTELEQSQRNDPHVYLKTQVESVKYKKGLSSTAPYVEMCVWFINLLIVPVQIVACKLYEERSDDSQINCDGDLCQLAPQQIQIDDDINVKSVSIDRVNLRIRTPDIVAQRIKECAENRANVQYTIRIEWELQIEYFGSYKYKGYLSYKEIPNLGV